jgi:flagella synthesis protein FlgN
VSLARPPEEARAAARQGEGLAVHAVLSRPALSRLLRDAEADVADYSALAVLLEEQFISALQHKTSALPALAERITRLVDTLDERRCTREALVSELLGSTTRPSMAALFARLPAASRAPVEALWQRLESAVQDCKARNTRNAHLMSEQHAIMQRVLFGEEAGIYADA